MEIKTLRDLKLALKDIPDNILEEYGVGIYEEPFCQLLVWMDEIEASEFDEKNNEQYPQLKDINVWIENISKLSQDKEFIEEGTEEPISSTMKRGK